jgi:hypothetical protein
MSNFILARVLRLWIYSALLALVVAPAGAASLFVAAGGDLQGALNQARAGDTITLQAGATFTGHFQLAPNSGATITIQSSGITNLPSGQRVTPSQASQMAKIATPDPVAALMIFSGANNYVIQGLEITEASGVYVQDLIQSGSGGETSTSQLPQNIVFDRDYIHGDPVSGGKRGIALNSGNTTIKNSYFADFISTYQDTQAVCGWNGSGPFTIQNNHLESGTEILAFGGATPAISGLIPSNITVQNNEFYKPTRYFNGASDYAGIQVWAKNHIELKNAQNVTIQNNTFTNNFRQADQLGFTLVLNVRDEGGTAPWATVSNVTVKNNTFQHVAAGVLLMGHDGDGGGTAGGFTFQNNLWTNMGEFGGDGRMYEILNGVQGATIDHDTAFPTGWLMVFAQGASSGIVVTNSIYTNGSGIAGDGAGQGESSMVAYDNSGAFHNNNVMNGNSGQYSGSHFASNQFFNQSQVAFNSDYSLSSSSPLRGLGTDGKDLGYAPSTSTTTTTAPLVPTGWVKLVNRNSGKCLDLPYWSGSNWGTVAGTIIQQYTCSGADMQLWQFTPVSGGYKIVNKLSGQALDITGISTQPGAALTQWPYWGGQNETFQVTATGSGYVRLTVQHSGQSIDVGGASTANGAPIVQWPYFGGLNEQWQLVPVQ